MVSKKTAASKRANLPRASDYTREFQKDWVRLSHSGRYDMHRLKEAMLLLIYTLDDSGKSGFVVFVRSGTHSELFS